MIVLVSANNQPARQLLVTKRTAIAAVQALLGLQTAKTPSIEWLLDDGTWAAADPAARLYEVASDLRGDGSSAKKAFRVRSSPVTAEEQGGSQDAGGSAVPARDGAAAAHENAVAAGRQPRSSSCETACAPVSPKQLTEAPAPTDLAAQPPAAVAFPPAVTATSTATAPARAPAVPAAAAAAAAGQDPIAPVARHDGLPAGCGMRHSKSHGALPSAEDVDPADGNAGVGAGRSGSGGAGVFEAVSRARLEATLPLLAGGSHIAVVDPRRPARDAMATALMRALPELQASTCAIPQAFRPLRLTFDRVQPFQAGLDGFWRWVLEGLHDAAPDLFPAAGLPGDASGFEEAFSADRMKAAPPVVLICSEACALADASSWFVSRFLGTLRDMGNEQHRFFLHAVAMIGGEPLRNVDMEAYMCKMSTSLSSTLESTQQQLRQSSRTSSRSHSGSISRRIASSAMSKRSASTHGSRRHGGSRKDGALARGSANSGGSGGSSSKSTPATSAATAPAGVRRSVSGSSAMGPASSRSRLLQGEDDSRLETLHSVGSGDLQQRRGRNSAASDSLAAAEAAVLSARLRQHEGSTSNSSAGGSGTPKDASNAEGVGADGVNDMEPLLPRSPAKPLSEKVKRLAAAFARNDAGSTANGAASGA